MLPGCLQLALASPEFPSHSPHTWARTSGGTLCLPGPCRSGICTPRPIPSSHTGGCKLALLSKEKAPGQQLTPWMPATVGTQAAQECSQPGVGAAHLREQARGCPASGVRARPGRLRGSHLHLSLSFIHFTCSLPMVPTLAGAPSFMACCSLLPVALTVVVGHPPWSLLTCREGCDLFTPASLGWLPAVAF